MSAAFPDRALAEAIFTPAQMLVLCTWFGLPPPRVTRLEEDDWEVVVHVDDVIEELGVTARGETSLAEIDVAVARILLAGIADQLPNWAAVDLEEGLVHLERDNGWAKAAAAQTAAALWSQRLLIADWSQGGMMSWPEEYRLFWLPGFERHVVTGSADSTGLYGQTDFALGWFERDVDMLEGVGAALMGWWSEQASNWEQRPWRLLWTGLVDEPTALGCRDAVWCGDETDEEDEDD